MITPTAAFLFFVPIFLGLLRCSAENVTVYLNDPRLVTFPPNWNGLSAYSTLCDGTRWTNLDGQSVSLTFTGVLVTVNFFVEYRGSGGQITIDDIDVGRVDTYRAGVVDQENCIPLPWSSSILPKGNHTIKVAQFSPGATGVYLWMRSFVYMTEDPTSTTTVPGPTSTTPGPTNTGPPNKKSSKIGVIAGVVAGVVAVLFVTGAIFLCLRRNRTRRSPVPKPLIEDNVNVTPFQDVPPYYNQEPHSRPGPVVTASPPIPGPGGPSTYSGSDTASLSLSSASAPLSVMHTIERTNVNTPLSSYPFLPPQPPSSYQTHSPSDFPNPTTSMPTPINLPPTERLLSHEELDLVRRLAERNVPAPALTTIIESMARSAEENNTSGEGQTFFHTKPPGYDFKG